MNIIILIIVALTLFEVWTKMAKITDIQKELRQLEVSVERLAKSVLRIQEESDVLLLEYKKLRKTVEDSQKPKPKKRKVTTRKKK